MGKPKYLYTRTDGPEVAAPRPDRVGGKKDAKTVADEVRTAPVDPQKAAVVSAFIMSHRDIPSVNKVNMPLPYVIIGRGFAATLNLVTLLKSPWGLKRLGGRPVIFIGYPDPWMSYIGHNMNQEVELLTLPGFKNRPAVPGALEDKRWLRSGIFAGLTESEMGEIKKACGTKIYFRTAVVKTIKKVELVYEIELVEGDKIKAAKVDICVGTGQAGLKGDITFVPKELKEGYENPMKVDAEGKFEQQPRVFAAEQYVRSNVKAAILGGRSVCFHGASPASIQALEHALGLDGEVADPSERVDEAFIYATTGTGMNEGFLPGGRLDDLARTIDGKPLPKRHDTATLGKLKPGLQGIWFGEDGYKITKIEEGETVKAFLRVTFAPGKRLVDAETDVDGGPSAPTKYITGLYDQVVIGSGRLRDAYKLLDASLIEGLKFVDTGHDFPVAAECDPDADVGGGIRLLGAAGLNYIYTARNEKTKLDAYQSSFPCQARVNCEGVTLAAVTIAYANRYFLLEGGKCNYNVNTASAEDLKLILPGHAPLVEKILLVRNCRISPFKSFEHLITALEWYDTEEALQANRAMKPHEFSWFINHFNDDSNLLEGAKLESIKRIYASESFKQPWLVLKELEKPLLKVLTFDYGRNGNSGEPDKRDYPAIY